MVRISLIKRMGIEVLEKMETKVKFTFNMRNIVISRVIERGLGKVDTRMTA